MKVLLELNADIRFRQMASIFDALPDFQLIFWEKNRKPTFDIIDETQPDIVIITNDQVINQEVGYALSDYPKTKLVVFNERPASGVVPDLVCYWPDIIHSMDQWMHYDGKRLGFSHYANPVMFRGGKPEERFKCDVIAIPARHEFMDMPSRDEARIKQYNSIATKFDLKVFGRRVPHPNYVGDIRAEEIPSAILSSRIYLDCNDMCAKGAEFLGIPVVNWRGTDMEIISEIENLLADEELYADQAGGKMYEAKSETYLHRINKMFEELELEKRINVTDWTTS
jgi:hypothetical protein